MLKMAKSQIGPDVEHMLIVEGTHEVDFFEKLLDEHGLSNTTIQILPLGGKTKLGVNLKTLILDPRFSALRSLGIVRDADSLTPNAESPSAEAPTTYHLTAASLAFDAVCGCLRNANLPVPTAHSVISDTKPRVGVFIMPDGIADGMLETLCRESVQTLPTASCVDSYFRCVESITAVNEFSPKAWTHAFIAIQEDPDVPLGKAAKKSYWNLHDQAFNGIVDFLRNLNPSTPS